MHYRHICGAKSKGKSKLLLFGCIIILLLSIAPIFTVQAQTATVIFKDGFETGNFGAWSGSRTAGDGVTSNIQAAVRNEGIRAMRVTVADGARESGACRYKNLGNSYSSIDARVYMLLSAKPSNRSVLEIFGFSTNGWLPNVVGARVDVVNNNGTLQWRLNYYNNGWQRTTVGSISVNVWYCVELKVAIGSGTGETRLYVNGAEALAMTGLNNRAAGSPRYFSLGVDDLRGNNRLTAYFDSVVVASGYIGPIPSQPTPTPTASPTPTPSPTPIPTPTILFGDGFESLNTNAWTSTISAGTGVTSSIQTTTVNEGSGALRITVADGAGENGRCLYKDLGNNYGGTIDARAYVQLSAKPALGAVLEMFGFSSDGWIPNALGARVDIVNNNGVAQWRLVYYNNGWQSLAVGSINPGVWYCVEFKLTMGIGSGEARLYVNGVELAAKTGLSNTAQGNSVRYFSLGVDDELGSNNFNAYFDSIVVAQGYIGPVSTNPTPTPSPTSSPTPTPTPIGYAEAAITKPIQASWIANDGTLYAGSNNILYKSQDQGKTWQTVLTFSGSNPTILCVYVNRLNYVFAVPHTSAATNSLGIWRSTNGGQTWSRVLPLPPGCTVMSMSEDTNGNLFAGIYTTGFTGNASICRSTDGGAHWTTVYYSSSGRHIHCVTVDKSNNYIYASIGDDRVDPSWHSYIIRATNGGASNSSWTPILGLPQMVAIEAVDMSAPGGSLVPVARLFATDQDNGQLYRTTDDIHFSLVLDTGDRSYGFWIRTNNLNGNIYASFTTGEGPLQWIAGIWMSNNGGLSWSLYKSFPVHYPYYGSDSASNFFQGIMYYDVRLDSGWQNGVKIYPIYSTQSATAYTPTILAQNTLQPVYASLCLVSVLMPLMVPVISAKNNARKQRLISKEKIKKR